MEPDTTLYHYTSAHGLLGMIRDRALWATESNHLNDPGEVSFASRALLQELTALSTEAVPSDPGLAERVQEVVDLLQRAYVNPHSIEQYREDRSFVTSFSKRDDQLSLWRAYAGQFGFCVGFSAQRLLAWFGMGYPSDAEVTSSPWERRRLLAVRENYGLDARVAEVSYGQGAVEALVETVRAALTEQSADSRSSRVRQALRGLAEVKHEGFAEEEEVRLIVQETGDFAPRRKARVSPSFGLVSYHSVAFDESAVRSVTIAPGANVARVRSALNSMFYPDAKGTWGHLEFRECEIPFAW